MQNHSVRLSSLRTTHECMHFFFIFNAISQFHSGALYKHLKFCRWSFWRRRVIDTLDCSAVRHRGSSRNSVFTYSRAPPRGASRLSSNSSDGKSYVSTNNNNNKENSHSTLNARAQVNAQSDIAIHYTRVPLYVMDVLLSRSVTSSAVRLYTQTRVSRTGDLDAAANDITGYYESSSEDSHLAIGEYYRYCGCCPVTDDPHERWIFVCLWIMYVWRQWCWETIRCRAPCVSSHRLIWKIIVLDVTG